MVPRRFLFWCYHRGMATNWIGKATDKMKEKGTLGKFGAATPGKIAAAKKHGGVAEKEAVFAQNMKNIAKKKSPFRGIK